MHFAIFMTSAVPYLLFRLESSDK